VKRIAARAGVRLHGVDGNGRPVALDDAGENVSRVSPHTLRRTFGSDLLNRGVRIEVVSSQLGHASVKITEKAYANLRTQTQRAELLRLGTGFPSRRANSWSRTRSLVGCARDRLS
jgi:integrase